MTPGAVVTALSTGVWIGVCDLAHLTPGRGVAALVGARQVAIFRIDTSDAIAAISNHDPFSDAFVLSRGVVGSAGDVVTVASPMYKQRFDVASGRCLDDPDVVIAVYPVRVGEGRVEVWVDR
jgi:nitrite reductase (NADH) small subunit